MGKAVLMSIQPYWVFLIIAKKMGWNIGKEKTIEVRKNYPKGENWNKVAKIYCSKDKKSFSKIPKKYQPLMEQFLGKVIGEFVCECIEVDDLYNTQFYQGYYDKTACLNQKYLINYGHGEQLYFWHISNLVIYDQPKALSEFRLYNCRVEFENGYPIPTHTIKRPPQSWCYVEESDDN